MKQLALILSGILGLVIPIIFAWNVYINNIPQNIATWSMIFVLDFLGVVLVYKDGNKKPYLQLGWTVAAGCILLAITLNQNPFFWSWVESASLIFCGISIILWLTLNANKAIYAYIVAANISFIPLIVDYWYEPQRETLWLWLWTTLSCLLAIYGAPKKDLANIGVPVAVIIIDFAFIFLCIF